MNEDLFTETSYPPIQISWMQGSYNITIRGDKEDHVLNSLNYLKEKIQNSPASIGQPESVKPPVNNGKVCKVCGSSMTWESKTSKAGKSYSGFRCDNTNCKTDKGYRTFEFDK